MMPYSGESGGSDRVPVVFISYAHADEALRDELDHHIRMYLGKRVLTVCYDRQIAGGDDWDAAIKSKIDQADVILLLVSEAFLRSRHCHEEARRALDRAATGQVRVVPVILSPCDWQRQPFAAHQALPIGGQPLLTWPSREEAFRSVAKGIFSAMAPPPAAWRTGTSRGGGAGVESTGGGMSSPRHMDSWPSSGMYSEREAMSGRMPASRERAGGSRFSPLVMSLLILAALGGLAAGFGAWFLLPRRDPPGSGSTTGASASARPPPPQTGACAEDPRGNACPSTLFVQIATPSSTAPLDYAYPMTQKIFAGKLEFRGVRLVEARRNGSRVMGAIVPNRCMAQAVQRAAQDALGSGPQILCEPLDVSRDITRF